MYNLRHSSPPWGCPMQQSGAGCMLSAAVTKRVLTNTSCRPGPKALRLLSPFQVKLLFAPQRKNRGRCENGWLIAAGIFQFPKKESCPATSRTGLRTSRVGVPERREWRSSLRRLFTGMIGQCSESGCPDLADGRVCGMRVPCGYRFASPLTHSTAARINSGALWTLSFSLM